MNTQKKTSAKKSQEPCRIQLEMILLLKDWSAGTTFSSEMSTPHHDLDKPRNVVFMKSLRC